MLMRRVGKTKKKISYYDYWNSKGEYGKERIRRYKKRLKAHKANLLCPNCHDKYRESPKPCPYDYEMNSDINLCRCCDECRHNCAMGV